MGRYSKEDIIRMVREDDVEFIRMQFTDIFGQLKNVAITASQIEKAVGHLLCSLAYGRIYWNLCDYNSFCRSHHTVFS